MATGHIGDRVGVTHDPVAVGEPRVEHTEQAFRFRDVALTRPLVLVVLARKLMKETELTEHRANAAHLEHEPLNSLVAGGRIPRQELAALLGEIDQDRTGFKQRQRLPPRTVGIEDGRDLAVGIER